MRRPFAPGSHCRQTLVSVLVAGLGLPAAARLVQADTFTPRTLWSLPVFTNLRNRIAAGDFNGDGFDDLAVANAVTHTVRIYFGSAAADTVPDVTLLGTLNPDGSTTNFGTVIAAGDIDGDGFADLLVGAPLWGTGLAQTRPGRVYVYRGGTPPHTTADLEIPPPATAIERFGIGLNVVGDPNADGKIDWNVIDGAAASHLFLGGSPPDANEDWYLAPGVWGTLVSGGGDWNGDGFDDLVYYRNYEVSPSTTAVAFGGPGADLAPDVVVPDSLVYSASFADVDGDGIDDLVRSATYSQGDHAYVSHGSTSPHWTVDQMFPLSSQFPAPPTWDYADLNQDGCADFYGPAGVTFGGALADEVPDIPLPSGVVVSLDWNGDGKRDLAHAANGILRVYTLDRAPSTTVCPDLAGNGYVGVFADPFGRQACGSLPPGATDTLFVLARMSGGVAAGIDATEFRLEVPNPAGYTFIWEPGPNIWYSTDAGLLDLDAANPSNAAGAMLGLPFPCSTDPSQFLLLARVLVTNQGAGGATAVRVKRRVPGTYSAYNCPWFWNCADNVIPMTSNGGPSFDPEAFVFGLNEPQCAQCIPPFAKETLWLDTRDLDTDHLVQVATSQPLREGKAYLVSVDGNCSLAPASAWAAVCGSPDGAIYPSPGGGNGLTGWDAEFSYATPFNPVQGCPALPSSNELFQMATVHAFQHPTVENPGTGPTPGHFYKYIVQGRDRLLRIRQQGTLASGYGKLRIVVEELEPGPPGHFTTETLSLDIATPGAPGKAGIPSIRTVTTTTTQVLDRWHNYRVTVRGNFNPFSLEQMDQYYLYHCGQFDAVMDVSPGNYWTLAVADAEFLYSETEYEGAPCDGFPRIQGLRVSFPNAPDFDPVPDGGQPAAPDPGHVYRYTIPGSDSRASFYLPGVDPGGYGRISIEVEELGTVDVPPGTSASPPAFRMLGNAPDPFNPSTELRYQLPATGTVRVDVYDVRGRVVRHLFRGLQPAGVQQLRFDGRDDGGRQLASGVYIAHVESHYGAGTDRMVLLK